MKKWLMSAVGKDRPGIAAAFTQVLCELKCNIEDTSMAQLEDHFTMLLILTAPQEVTRDQLQSDMQRVLHDYNLQLAIHPIETESFMPYAAGTPWMISVSGCDQTGIMSWVTRYLAEKQINIRHLSSKHVTQPDGTYLFLMALEVDVPDTVDRNTLQNELSSLAQHTDLEIHAEPMDVYTL